MGTNKYNPAVIREAFSFLITEFNYSVIRDEESFNEDRPYAFTIEYTGNNRLVHLNYDYKENFFYFSVFKKESSLSSESIFLKIFKTFEPNLDFKAFQPNDHTCVEAALLNAQFLRKYGSNILQGREWI